MRIATLAAVTVIIAGSITAAPAHARDGGDPASAVLAQASGQAPGNGAAPAQGNGRPSAQQEAEPAPPPRRPRAAAPPRRDPRIDTAECTWVGKRTIRVLMRDDLIAAEGFLKFYNTFGCPVRYLGQAFGCALAGTDGAPVKDVESRIDVCWNDPTAKLEAAAPPAQNQGQGQGQGGQPPAAAPKPPPPPAARPPAPKPNAPAAKPERPEADTSYPKR